MLTLEVYLFYYIKVHKFHSLFSHEICVASLSRYQLRFQLIANRRLS